MRSRRSLGSRPDLSLIAHRQIFVDRALAQLQSADVGNDLPAIFRRQLIGIARHCAVAVGDHVVKMAGRRFAQTILMISRRVTEPALRDHPVSIAQPAVTWRASDIESVLASV